MQTHMIAKSFPGTLRNFSTEARIVCHRADMHTMITDWDIQALLDNELPEKQQQAVLNALRHDFSLRKRYNDLRRQRDLLRAWWKDQ